MDKNIKRTPEQITKDKEMATRQLEDFVMKKTLLNAVLRDYEAFIQQIQMALDSITKLEEANIKTEESKN